MPEPEVYLHGKFVPASQAHLNIYDFGIVLGATITDQLRTLAKVPPCPNPRSTYMASSSPLPKLI